MTFPSDLTDGKTHIEILEFLLAISSGHWALVLSDLTPPILFHNCSK